MQPQTRRASAPLIALAALVAAIAAGCVNRSMPIAALPDPSVVEFSNGAVAADHPDASRAGAAILRQGGNAVDAAVATAFAISVVRPESAGIGGGGFMIVHLAGNQNNPPESFAIDYRERAPLAMTPDHFITNPDADPRFSGHAVATPGTVAGLLHAHERFGVLPRRAVLQPAIDLALRGFTADEHLIDAARSLAREADTPPADDRPLADWVIEQRAAGTLPHPDVWRVLLRGGDIEQGQRLTNPRQAIVLELIAERGPEAFYTGNIARAIATAAQSAGGILTTDDLERYSPVETTPIRASFLGYELLLMPPPSSGGVAIAQTLNTLRAYDQRLRTQNANADDNDPTTIPPPLDAEDLTDPTFAHPLVESMKHAFADRSAFLGDPEVNDLPLDFLLSRAHAEILARRIDPFSIAPADEYGSSTTDRTTPDDAGTSHIAAVDAAGNAASVTETINLSFGSRVVVPGYGFALNNQVDDFTTNPSQPNAFGLLQSLANTPGPRKRPLSSMSPTIVLDENDRVFAVAGASGGPRIISATLQTLLHAMLNNASAGQAVNAPRLHHQWMPQTLFLEPELANDRAFTRAMGELGHSVETRNEIGAVQFIRRGRQGWQAASDPRKGGEPAGY